MTFQLEDTKTMLMTCTSERSFTKLTADGAHVGVCATLSELRNAALEASPPPALLFLDLDPISFV